MEKESYMYQIKGLRRVFLRIIYWSRFTKSSQSIQTIQLQQLLKSLYKCDLGLSTKIYPTNSKLFSKDNIKEALMVAERSILPSIITETIMLGILGIIGHPSNIFLSHNL